MAVKDNFSHNSQNYAQFRPSYPDEVFTFLETVLTRKERAWDCATGNGQVAIKLAGLFNEVQATDLSENQLKNAVSSPKIHYSQQLAEQTNFPKSCFDCVTVGQAIHWFDFEKFYREVNRTLKPNGIFVVLGYGNLLTDNEAVQQWIEHLYRGVLDDYWDPERKYIDEKYQTIPFPFEEITSPQFQIRNSWNREQLLGYLNTWSAVKHYTDKHQQNPVEAISDQLPAFDSIQVTFPILMRVGKASD